MKKLTIKTRIAIWYVISVLILCGVFAGILYLSINRSLYNAIYRTLEVSAFIIGDEVENERGFLEFENDLSLDNGVIYSVYDFDGNPILCNHKEYWLDALEGYASAPFSIRVDDETWWVLGAPAVDDEVHVADLRVAIKAGIVEDTTEGLYLVFFLLLPLIGLLSIIAAVLLARSALRPVENITRAAVGISKGDMSRRIQYDGRPDEIAKLAQAFDDMLDALQSAFTREKQFTSDASHELRTPLAVILAQAEAVLEEESVPQDEARAAMETIYHRAHYMQDMLSQLLLLARGREQEQAMEKTRLDMAAALEDVVEETLPRLEERQMRVQLNASEPCYIQGDLMLITRMLMNLLDNEAKYAREGGLICASARRQGEEIIVEIADDGPGIAARDVPHVFERFYRADASRTGSSGTGLGLSLVAWIVEAHKGSIHLESEEGKGCRFTLRFPSDSLSK